MIEVISCITFEHDLKLVLLAAFLCVGGSVTVVQLIRRAFASSAMARLAWIALASISMGTTVWCTHFIAMLAYHSKAPVSLDPVLTLLSLIVPSIVLFAAMCLFVFNPRPVRSLIGGAMIGLCTAMMHYSGMMAYRIDGLVTWDHSMVGASVFLSCVLSALSVFSMVRTKSSKLGIAAIGLFVVGVICLHFTGMTAMHVTPLAMSNTPLNSSTFTALSMATALAGILVIGTGSIGFFLDFDNRRSEYDKLLRMALTDNLTGLPNRNAYIDDLSDKISSATRNTSKLAVIGIDLNRFKDINDTYGHKAGDEVLRAVANMLCEDIKPDEFIARLGGDEFAATTLYKSDEDLKDFITRIEAAVAIHVTHETSKLNVGGSIGVAIFPQDGNSADTLRNNADLAMYRAKLHPSRNTIFYEASMDEEVRQKRELAAALSNALENNELELHYQLQASISTGKVSGMEALLRWTHHEHGPISPSVFIPIAEQSGLIVRLGEWVLRKACMDAAQWTNQRRVAVNVSPLQLMQVELPQIIHQTLIDTGLPPSRLEVELTETAIIEDRDRSLHVLRQIKALGVCVALDDFGTGYSSLEILRSFPFDKIKLDRFFMSEIETSSESRALVRSVLSLGRSLSIPVLAEGVESQLQLTILQEEGCDEVQGFFLGRPQKIEDFLQNQHFDFKRPDAVETPETSDRKTA